VIDFDTALSLVEKTGPCTTRERIPLEEALGRVLAGSVESPMDYPPFSKAAMDGFAVLEGDPSRDYTVLETLGAGDVPQKTLLPGTCIRIMTGAMVPPEAGRIVRVEYTDEVAGKIRPNRQEPLRNIIDRGENLKAGSILCGPRRLSSKDIGVLAAFGIDSVEAVPKPRVGILTTGSELVEPGNNLPPGRIYNSNGLQLAAQAREAGCHVISYGIIEDEPQILRSAAKRAIAECDFVLFTGGVSMGDFDYVPSILEECGVEIVFHHVSVKPGKPTLFGRKGKIPVFGLPGNPVSVFMIFEILVKPAIFLWTGIPYRPRIIETRLKNTFSRRHAERTEFVPVRVEQDSAVLVPYHGSAHLNALSEADGILKIEKNVDTIAAGSLIHVRCL
jgi:molybdopterin molybdotransferase